MPWIKGSGRARWPRARPTLRDQGPALLKRAAKWPAGGVGWGQCCSSWAAAASRRRAASGSPASKWNRTCAGANATTAAQCVAVLQVHSSGCCSGGSCRPTARHQASALLPRVATTGRCIHVHTSPPPPPLPPGCCLWAKPRWPTCGRSAAARWRQRPAAAAASGAARQRQSRSQPTARRQKSCRRGGAAPAVTDAWYWQCPNAMCAVALCSVTTGVQVSLGKAVWCAGSVLTAARQRVLSLWVCMIYPPQQGRRLTHVWSRVLHYSEPPGQAWGCTQRERMLRVQ